MVTSPWPSSRLISPPILSSIARCSGVGEQGHEPAVVERVLTTARGRRPPAPSASTKRFGSGSTDPSVCSTSAEEVLAHPRHAGELGAVGHLVEREPQPELARREGEALLEGEHVRADVVDEVLVVGARPRRPAGRTGRAPGPTSSRASCRPRRRRPSTRTAVRQPLGQPLLEPIGDRTQQALERGDVGLHPSGAVGDPRPGRAGERPQPGASATSSSACAVSSAKSGCSEA